MNNAYLIEGLGAFPRIAAALMERIDEAKIDAPTGPDRFSPREVIAHMADWEPRLLGRIQSAIQNPGATVPVWDEGELAIENAYAAADWRDQLEKFRTLRGETIAYLKSLSPEDWNRIFVHPERGPMTIEDQAGFFLGHDLYHSEQLAAVAN